MESKLVCRTCLVDTGELFEVFGDTGNELSLSTKISEHLKISIEPLDEYALMCGRCIGILNEFHDMYSLAHEIQPHFTDYKNVEVQQDEEIVTAEYIVEEEDEEEMVNHMEEVIIEEAVPDYGTELVHSDPENEAEEEEVEEGEISVEETPSLTLAPGQRKQSRTEQSAARIEEENELVRQVINLACTDCDAVPLTFDDLMLHYREVHLKDGVLTCCKREFNQRRKVVEHAKLHVNPAEFSCVECKKNFASKYYLTHHMSIHVPEELCEYPCEKCTKRFPTKSRLTNHMKVHNEYDLSCHICGKAFNHKPTLYNHIRSVHEQATQLTCGVCSKVFKTREGYQSHMVSHMETPPPRVTCHICGKKMKNRDTLNQHLQRHKHENDRIYCEICNREFNCKKRLNQHRKYVHNPVLLKCEHCEKTFKRPICLKEHMASHTGQQLYTCAYCPRQFNSNANKYSHQKAQHRAEWSLDKQRKEMEG